MVITGTTSDRKLSKDVFLAAQSSATVVILMGMSKLNEIVKAFISNGKSEIPVAIIQNGTTSSEKFGIGRVNNIEKVVEENKLSSPAIIVVGEVVAHSSKFRLVYDEVLKLQKK